MRIVWILSVRFLLVSAFAVVASLARAEVHVSAYTNAYGMTGAAVQAAIDAAFAARDDRLALRRGHIYYVSRLIFLDPPDNLRVSLAAPTQFSFSMGLVGASGPSNMPNGCTIQLTHNDGVGLWVGTGQAMTVQGINITGPQPTRPPGFRIGLPNTGIGIAIGGGRGGASRTLLENVAVNLLYYGIMTSVNGVDQLADSTTIRKCSVTAAIGISFALTNNLINSVQDCVISAVNGSTGINMEWRKYHRWQFLGQPERQLICYHRCFGKNGVADKPSKLLRYHDHRDDR